MPWQFTFQVIQHITVLNTIQLPEAVAIIQRAAREIDQQHGAFKLVS